MYDKGLGENLYFFEFNLTRNNSFLLNTSIYEVGVHNEEPLFSSRNGMPIKQLSQDRKWYQSLEEYRQNHHTI